MPWFDQYLKIQLIRSLRVKHWSHYSVLSIELSFTDTSAP